MKMTRCQHYQSDEINFGSDSFLDIVANIVGMLIILIVIVGVRVKNAPAPVLDEAARVHNEAERQARQREWEAAQASIDTENQRRREEFEQALKERSQELAQRRRLQSEHQQQQAAADQGLAERLRAIDERQALLRAYEAEAAELNRQVAQLSPDLAAQVQAREAAATESRNLQAKLDQEKAELQRLEAAVQAESAAREIQEEKWHSVRQQIEQLHRQIAELKRTTPLPKKWVHYATPISQRVQRKEVHFRCLKDRVVHIPLDELTGQMERSLSGKKPPPHGIVRGTVGPVGGFRLRYQFNHARPSLSRQLSDPFTYTLYLDYWELLADADELGEPQPVALAESSQFQAVLASRPPAIYAITIWVYPDSFGLARALKDHLHALGYIVALRPLPFGLPIAATPVGSASRVQ